MIEFKKWANRLKDNRKKSKSIEVMPPSNKPSFSHLNDITMLKHVMTLQTKLVEKFGFLVRPCVNVANRLHIVFQRYSVSQPPGLGDLPGLEIFLKRQNVLN